MCVFALLPAIQSRGWSAYLRPSLRRQGAEAGAQMNDGYLPIHDCVQLCSGLTLTERSAGKGEFPGRGGDQREILPLLTIYLPECLRRRALIWGVPPALPTLVSRPRHFLQESLLLGWGNPWKGDSEGTNEVTGAHAPCGQKSACFG